MEKESLCGIECLKNEKLKQKPQQLQNQEQI